MLLVTNIDPMAIGGKFEKSGRIGDRDRMCVCHVLKSYKGEMVITLSYNINDKLKKITQKLYIKNSIRNKITIIEKFDNKY